MRKFEEHPTIRRSIHRKSDAKGMVPGPEMEEGLEIVF
jgi:hypothetical protein